MTLTIITTICMVSCKIWLCNQHNVHSTVPEPFFQISSLKPCQSLRYEQNIFWNLNVVLTVAPNQANIISKSNELGK